MKTVDVLAICAHPDDSELICGGTLAKSVALGHTAGIVALTRGELGTKGTPKLRDEESAAAARVLGVTLRESLDFPDGGVVNTPENRTRLAVLIRQARPSVVITHWLR